MLNQSQRNFAYVTTDILSWHVQYLVIGIELFKPEHCKFCLNFELDRVCETTSDMFSGISVRWVVYFLHEKEYL